MIKPRLVSQGTTLIAALIFSCIGFAVTPPSASTAESSQTTVAEWTVMVYLNADNNLEPDGITDFLEMAQVGSTEQVNVVVQFDRSPAYSKLYGNWNNTLRFRVMKNMKPESNEAVEDLGEVDMGDAAALRGFVDWAQMKYPARRYFLIIWDHGQGWRFLQRIKQEHLSHIALLRRSDQIKRVSINAGLILADLGLAETVPSGMRYISTDDTSGSKLYNRAIADALAGLPDGRKIDVLGMDACLMAMVETGYALRNVATVMVASEELEPSSGWAYWRWLTPLTQSPTTSAEDLGKLLVDAYSDAYGLNADHTLSAIRLGLMSELADATSQLADNLIAAIPTDVAVIKTARRQCTAYGKNLHGIDLGYFCQQLVNLSKNKALISAAESVSNVLQRCVVANMAGFERQAGYGSTGLAIYFPESGEEFNQDPDRDGYLESNQFQPVEFVQNHRWDNFLAAYFVAVPQ